MKGLLCSITQTVLHTDTTILFLRKVTLILASCLTRHAQSRPSEYPGHGLIV